MYSSQPISKKTTELISAIKENRRLLDYDISIVFQSLHSSAANSNNITEMSNMCFLEFQYHIRHISKRNISRKPSRQFSSRDRQSSGLEPFEPDENEMKQVFDMIDKDKDGKISQEDYKAMLKVLGKDDLIQAVPKIFEAVDLKRDRVIDFKEFMEYHKKGGGVKWTDLLAAFRVFDLNGDGKICAEDLQGVLSGLGEGCSQEDCQRMVRAVDIDGDGVVKMNDFLNMMTRSMKHV